MNRIKVFTVVFTLALLCLTFQGIARADDSNKMTTVTLNAPVEVPGVKGPIVIGPGTFVFTLAYGLHDDHVVQIFNADQTKLLTTAFAVADYYDTTAYAVADYNDLSHHQSGDVPADKTIIKFRETAPHSPQAITEWIYPGASYGLRFLYNHKGSEAMALSKASDDQLARANASDVTPQGGGR